MRTMLTVICAAAISSCTTTKPVRQAVCPPSFKKYSKAQQTAAADALRNAAPILKLFMTDFGRVRAELRAGGCKEN